MNQASTAQIGTSEVDLLTKEIHSSGEIAIVSAASATNQNAWIGYMKTELKKYPKMKLVSIVYGNDDPTTATQVTQGLLQQYPNLKGIISPTTVGILAAAQVLDTPKYCGKIALTGLGTPNSLKKFVADGAIQAFELWNPASLGNLAAYAAVMYASGKLNGSSGQSFTAGKLGSFTIGPDKTILLGPPLRAQQGQYQQVQLLAPSGRAGPARLPASSDQEGRPSMERVCFTARVRPDRLEEYAVRHRAVWPGMTAALSAAGRGNYSLFLAGDGFLIGYLETDDFDAAQRQMAQTDVNERWQAEMKGFFEGIGERRPDEGFGRVAEIFHLE